MIWSDLDEYYLILERLVSNKINKFILKNSTGKQKIVIKAEYVKSNDKGRYLYEFGQYSKMVPPLQNKILKRLNITTIGTRAVFNKLKITYFSNEKVKNGLKFKFNICIKRKN